MQNEEATYLIQINIYPGEHRNTVRLSERPRPLSNPRVRGQSIADYLNYVMANLMAY
jgi:hypothetical protein